MLNDNDTSYVLSYFLLHRKKRARRIDYSIVFSSGDNQVPYLVNNGGTIHRSQPLNIFD